MKINLPLSTHRGGFIIIRNDTGGRVMANVRQMRKIMGCIGILMVLTLCLTGCATLLGKTETTTSEKAKEKKGPQPLYYDFGDVLIPGELKVDRKNSFVYKAPTFSAGVLVLNGRVEMTSLIAFFENNMTKDNWIPISSFKSPRTILLFQKESRWCVVNITDKDFSTHTEIWVAPTVGGPEAGLLK
jgi:hypothetical protein